MTTITVGSMTHRFLKKLKEKRGAKTFDELLGDIAEEQLEVPDSLFGTAPGIEDEFEREHEDRL